VTSLLPQLAQYSCADDYDPDSLPVAKAREIIRALVSPVSGTERLFVRNALGRVLSEDVISPLDVPGHDNSAMDGYAVRFADLSAQGDTLLRVAGTALAGRPFAAPVDPGECVRIMTGAVIPGGTDTVVIQEVVIAEGDRVRVPAGQKQGQNLRRAGEDLRRGRPALPAGCMIRPAELGLLASLGIAEVPLRRRVRVAVFSTGDELCSIGAQPRSGEIFDSNRYTIYGMLTRLGCEVLDLGVVRDDPVALEATLRMAADNADAIITSGGVSVGEADFIHEIMGRLGEVAFWKIAMKPGRPMAFGKIAGDINSAYLFGLPGNPVAVMVTFYQFVRDALLRLMGVAPLPPTPLLRVQCDSALKKAPGRTEFQRGRLYREDGIWRVQATGAQGSGVLRSMSEANCFIVLEHARGDVAVGDEVSVQLMEGFV
jgi:molybdopterin molybdotransferase